MTGRASVIKGKQAERDVAHYFTMNGQPLRRWVRTGDAQNTDEGDLVFDGVTIEVKHWGGDLTIGSVETLLRKLAVQKQPGDLGLLIDRLDFVGDQGKWRVWLTVTDFLMLTGTRGATIAGRGSNEPVCVRLAYVVEQLRLGGWINPVDPFAM